MQNKEKLISEIMDLIDDFAGEKIDNHVGCLYTNLTLAEYKIRAKLEEFYKLNHSV